MAEYNNITKKQLKNILGISWHNLQKDFKIMFEQMTSDDKEAWGRYRKARGFTPSQLKILEKFYKIPLLFKEKKTENN